MSLNRYTLEFKKKVIDLHKKCGRTYKSIADEYGVSKASISRWCSESQKNLQLMKTHNLEKENLSLKQENIELRKKIAFLKKTTVFFCKGNKLGDYQFVNVE